MNLLVEEKDLTMVNFDLRKLSAPVEALRPELDEAYKRLDAKWEGIATCLNGLSIPCSVSYTFSVEDPNHPENYDCLVWKKWNGKKRICIEACRFYSDYDVTTTPYDEWSGQQRIDMLEHVPCLFDAAAKQTKDFIDKTKN